MRSVVVLILLLGACSSLANHLGNPLLLPWTGFGTAAENRAYIQRRGKVEIIVKSGFPAIIDDIRKGGGPVLSEAMEAARIPENDREARILQMQGDIGLYAQNPGALVIALMVYGGKR